MKGRGCENCNNTGYKGRVGLYEVMEITEELRELDPGRGVRARAAAQGDRGRDDHAAAERPAEGQGRRHDDRGSRAGDGALGKGQGNSWPRCLNCCKTTVELNGSDLHLTTATPPQVRVHGKLQRLELPELSPAETKQLAYSVLTDAQKKRFEETLELDFSFGIRGVARFRCNVFNQRGAVAAVYRLIPEKIRDFSELGLPPVISRMAERPRGLVLVTGPTGSGKSTTLAAMIDKINQERHEHILTIEDPIEYIHPHKGCLVNQREVHSDTHGLRARAARRPARRPGRRAHRRDARPRDGRGGAADRRDRPPDVRHAAHQLGRPDDQPHHRRLPGAPAGADPDAALAGARRHRLPGAAADRQRPGPRGRRSRSWCRRPPSAT